jgi:hypothetical protein
MLSRQSVTIRASTSSEGAKPKISMPPALERRCKEIAERRKVIEQSRSLNVRRIQQELQRISQRELEYAQRIFSEYTPIRLSANESVWSRWKEFLPFHLEFVEDKKEGEAAANTTTTAENTEPLKVDESDSTDAPIA